MLRRPSLWVVWSNLWWFLLLWTTRTLVVGQQNEDGGKSITEIVETKPNLVLFRELWEHTSLAFTLNDPTARYTLFAPDNSGFTTEFLYEDFLRGTQWRGHLLHFLQHHLIPHQELAQVDLGGPSTTTLTTAANEPLTVSFSRVGNNQSILEPNLMASNGMVHVVQGPLLSPSLQQTLLETLLNRKDTYSIFAELVSRAGLERLLRGAGGTPLTILAPPNTAFDDLGPPFLATLRNPDNVHYLRVLLLHHILPTNIYQWPTTGTTLTSLVPTTLFCSQDPHTGLVRINDAIVSHNTNSSLYTRNGMLYPVRRVLIPPSVVSMVQNVHLLTSSGYPRVLSLTTFSQWLALTGFDRDLHVASHLNQPNPVTVLAPLDQNNNDDNDDDDDMSVLLTKWEQPDWLHHLRAIVRYHMVAGIYPTLDKETSLRNLYGQNLTVSHVTNHQDNGSPQTIELSTGAAGGLSSLSSTTTRLVQPTNPLLVYNATIHVVDRVLVPPQLQMTILQQLRRVPQFSKLVEWLQQTGLDRDLENGVGPMTLFAPLNQAFDDATNDITTPIATNNQSETPLWRGRNDPLSSSSPLDGYTLTEKRNLLLHHWLPTNVFTYELQDSTQLETRLLGQTVTVLQMEDQIEIQGSLLDETNANRMASNGVIHPVSDLWWPPPPVASSTDPLPPPPDDTLLLPPHHEDGVNEQAEGSDSIQVRFPNQEDNNNNNNKEDKPTTTTTTTRSNSAGNNIASKPGILAAVVCGVWAAWLL